MLGSGSETVGAFPGGGDTASSRSSTSTLMEKRPSPRSGTCSAKRPDASTGCTSSRNESPMGSRGTLKPEPRGCSSDGLRRETDVCSQRLAARLRGPVVAMTTWSSFVIFRLSLSARPCTDPSASRVRRGRCGWLSGARSRSCRQDQPARPGRRGRRPCPSGLPVRRRRPAVWKQMWCKPSPLRSRELRHIRVGTGRLQQLDLAFADGEECRADALVLDGVQRVDVEAE